MEAPPKDERLVENIKKRYSDATETLPARVDDKANHDDVQTSTSSSAKAEEHADLSRAYNLKRDFPQALNRIPDRLDRTAFAELTMQLKKEGFKRHMPGLATLPARPETSLSSGLTPINGYSTNTSINPIVID